jgi:hypothetical protein
MKHPVHIRGRQTCQLKMESETPIAAKKEAAAAAEAVAS